VSNMSTPNLFFLVSLSAFLATFLGTKILIRKVGFLRLKKPLDSKVFFGQDMAKPGTVFVPTIGGLAITFGFIFAVLLSLKFIDKTSVVSLLAALVTTLMVSIIGFLDDIFIVRRIWRLILPGIAALPLVIIESGSPKIHLLGSDIILGDFYRYLLIPLGVIACANLINILAGFNGLEAGSGGIACVSVFIASAILMKLEPQKYTLSTPLLMLAMTGACVAFLIFNWCPAKIFPGNIGTYVIGAAIASAVIIGDMEKVGMIALTPQIIEFLLKLRGRLKVGNFGVLINGSLGHSGKVSSLTHLFMKYTKVNEKGLVLYLLGFQALAGIIAVWSVFWYR